MRCTRCGRAIAYKMAYEKAGVVLCPRVECQPFRVKVASEGFPVL